MLGHSIRCRFRSQSKTRPVAHLADFPPRATSSVAICRPPYADCSSRSYKRSEPLNTLSLHHQAIRLNSLGYTVHGAVERMHLANGRWEHTNFNNRLQPLEIGLGSSATESSLLKLKNEHGTNATRGNVLKQVITVSTIGTATGFTANQHYRSDQLNRLIGAQEVNGVNSAWKSSGILWQKMFTYDRFGIPCALWFACHISN